MDIKLIYCLLVLIALFSQQALAGRTINSVTINGDSSLTTTPNQTVTLTVNVTIDGKGNEKNWKSTAWLIAKNNSDLNCSNHVNINQGGEQTLSFTVTTPNTAGTYNLYLVAYNDNFCNGSDSNQFELVDAITVNEELAQIDHFRLSYSSGLSCLASEVTLQACQNSDCSSLYTEQVNITLSAAGTWSNKLITLTTGQTTDLTFQASNAGDTPLAISSTDVSAANVLQCYQDGVLDLDCTMPFTEAGFVFDVPTLTACKTSTEVTIRAVQLDKQTNQCTAALTGNQSVNFFSSFVSPTSGTNLLSISATPIDNSSPGTAVNLSFNADGEAIFTAQYADAGQVRLDAEFDNGRFSLSGNDSFVSQPAALYVYSDDANANCASGDANCSVFKKAGETFNLKINAACWQSDSDNDFSDNPTTPNFELDAITITPSLVAPTGGSNANLGTSSFNFVSSDDGTHSVSQTVSEVGVFSFDVSPPSYFGETLTTQASNNIGRFTPDHFTVTSQSNGAFGSHSCGTFSYTGQSFSYQTAPSLVVTAHTTTNGTTQNYTGSFAKLMASDFSITPPTTDAWQLGADNTNLLNLTWSPVPASLNDNGDGSFSFSFGNDSYQYLKQTNSQVAPFSNTVVLSFSEITDSDGVQTQSLPVTLQASGENIRFGRIVVNNAHGSELSPLPVGLQTEYFDGVNWQTNTADTCSSLALATHIRLQNVATNSGALQSGSANMIIENGTTSISNFSFANGEGSLFFTAPGEDNQGYVDIQTNLTGSYDWLLDDIDNDGSFDDEASGKASFGIFKGSDRIIFRREVY